jgi:hypothetical protein
MRHALVSRMVIGITGFLVVASLIFAAIQG